MPPLTHYHQWVQVRTSVGEHSEHSYIDTTLHEFVTLVLNIMLYIQRYENMVDTDRTVFSELRQTDND